MILTIVSVLFAAVASSLGDALLASIRSLHWREQSAVMLTGVDNIDTPLLSDFLGPFVSMLATELDRVRQPAGVFTPITYCVCACCLPRLCCSRQMKMRNSASVFSCLQLMFPGARFNGLLSTLRDEQLLSVCLQRTQLLLTC